jgi:hypothetical protein
MREAVVVGLGTWMLLACAREAQKKEAIAVADPKEGAPAVLSTEVRDIAVFESKAIIATVTGDRKTALAIVSRPGGEAVMVNNVQSPVYARIVTVRADSRDGDGRWAYVAQDRHGAAVFASSRGGPPRTYASILTDSIVFDPTGGRIAFVAEATDGSYGAVYDDSGTVLYANEKRLAIRKAPIAFSSDGRLLAFVAGAPHWSVFLSNGSFSEPFDDIALDMLRFDQASEHVYFVARVRGKALLTRQEVRTGKTEFVSPGVEAVVDLALDGTPIYYAVRIGSRAYSVWPADIRDAITGERPIFDSVARDSLTWDKARRRLGYVALRGGKELVVINDKVEAEYDEILGSRFWFSADGKVLCHARQGTTYAIIEGGKTVMSGSKDYGADSLMYSPGGSHIAYVEKTDGRAWHVVVDGIRSEALQGTLPKGLAPVFIAEDKILATTIDGTRVLNTVMTIPARGARGADVR